MSRLTHHLPDVADARRAGLRVRSGILRGDLLEKRPDAQRITAALVVRGLLQVRQVETMTLDISWERAESMAKEPPAPKDGFEDGQSAYVARLHSDAPRACSFDAPGRAGWVVCSVCTGSGYVEEERQQGRQRVIVRVPCYGCRGRTVIQCSNCDGTGRSVRADVVKVLDRVVTIDEVLVPRLGAELEAPVRDTLHPIVDFPAPLARDLMTWKPESDLRALGDDLPELYRRAIELGQRMGAAQATLRAFETFVVPLLVLDYGAKRVVLYRAGETWKAHHGDR